MNLNKCYMEIPRWVTAKNGHWLNCTLPSINTFNNKIKLDQGESSDAQDGLHTKPFPTFSYPSSCSLTISHVLLTPPAHVSVYVILSFPRVLLFFPTSSPTRLLLYILFYPFSPPPIIFRHRWPSPCPTSRLSHSISESSLSHFSYFYRHFDTVT